MKFDHLIIDTMNLAYRVAEIGKKPPELVSKKRVFKPVIKEFILKINELEEKHLKPGGTVHLLFDNATSRIDLQSSFYFADRKQAYAKYKRDREKAPKEFYNSINLIKYYYMIADPHYHSIQIQRLEADDLVKPLLNVLSPVESKLMVTNDMDWTRYLSDVVFWMPHWDEIQSRSDLAQNMGFAINEKSIIAFKSLFGDSSDNIPSIISSKYEEYFPPLIEEAGDIETIIDLSKVDSEIERFPILGALREVESERQLRINIQLVGSIPVADSYIEKRTVIGRDSKLIRQKIEEAVEITSADKHFVFGNIKRPREA